MFEMPTALDVLGGDLSYKRAWSLSSSSNGLFGLLARVGFLQLPLVSFCGLDWF